MNIIDKYNNLLIYSCNKCNRIYYFKSKDYIHCNCDLIGKVINNKKILDCYNGDIVKIQCVNCGLISTINYNDLIEYNDCINCKLDNYTAGLQCFICKNIYEPTILNIQRNINLCPNCYKKNRNLIRLYDDFKNNYKLTFTLEQFIQFNINHNYNKIKVNQQVKLGKELTIKDLYI